MSLSSPLHLTQYDASAAGTRTHLVCMELLVQILEVLTIFDLVTLILPLGQGAISFMSALFIIDRSK